MSDYQDDGRRAPSPTYIQVSPREQYQKARNRRKTIIFGSTMVGLTIAFVLGYLGLQGSFLFPVGGDFHHEVSYAKVGDTPCPAEGARPVDPDDVRLMIYNTTSTPGLAGTVAEYFKEQGYYIGATDNAPLFRGFAEIQTGPRGVDAAYTVARFLGPETRIRLNQTEDKTLTVLVGERFTNVPSPEETQEIIGNNFALVPLQGCLPVKEPDGGWEVPSDLLTWQQSAIAEREAEEAEEG